MLLWFRHRPCAVGRTRVIGRAAPSIDLIGQKTVRRLTLTSGKKLEDSKRRTRWCEMRSPVSDGLDKKFCSGRHQNSGLSYGRQKENTC